jgi:hypothetical protein
LEGSDSDLSSGSSCYSDYECRRHVAKKGNKLAHKDEEGEKITLTDALQALELLTSKNQEATQAIPQ